MGFTDLEHREYARVRSAMRAPNAVFLFGANERGAHGKGAARQAWEEYGARWGVGEGMQGRSYALPTKDGRIRTLPLERIAEYVDRFVRFAHAAPELTFVVTRVGCGLAGYTDADMAPLFATAPENCLLPIGWREIAESRR